MLTDKLGRRFHYLRLSVTDVGNFRCSYCLPHGYQPTDESAHLSKAEAATVCAPLPVWVPARCA